MDLQFRPGSSPTSKLPNMSVEDGGQGSWAAVAEKHWLRSTPSKANANTIKTDIWEPLEREDFSHRSLLPLETLQILERFLWPTFSDEASNQHVLLVAIFFNVKQRSSLGSWSLFASRPEAFSQFFRRVLSLSLDASIAPAPRLALLNFIIAAFGSLEQDIVRKECAPLVSISIWNNLHNEAARETQLDKNSGRRKAWRAAQKRFDAATPEGQGRLKFERLWLFSITLDFLNRLNNATPKTSDVVYCERFLEFLTGLISQLPTRRYSIVLLQDLHVLPVIIRSQIYQSPANSLLRDLTTLFQHFTSLTADDSEMTDPNRNTTESAHYKAVATLQRVAFRHFESKLKVLALSNYSSVDTRTELEQHLNALSDPEVQELCELLHFRTAYPKSANIPSNRKLWQEVLLQAYAAPVNFRDTVKQLSISPTETSLYNTANLRADAYDGSEPLSEPKLNLQYLSLGDFMWRSFQLYQAEAFYGIRKDLESIVRRMKPRTTRDGVAFDGFTKMAMPIDKPAIIEVAHPKVGSTHPSSVRAEVILDVSRLTESMRLEWERLRPSDVVFLLSVRPLASTQNGIVNGAGAGSASEEQGIKTMRTAEVVQVLDENGKPLRDANVNGYGPRPRRRHLLIDIDPVAFQADKDRLTKGKSDVYASINVIARRQGRENNFKPILETVQQLVSSSTALPSWLEEVYLGYGDPKSASYQELATKIESVDFLDTFLDWTHLEESLPGQSLDVEAGQKPSFGPPYVLDPFTQQDPPAPSNPKKRRREQMENEAQTKGPIRVKTYKPRNTGPYPVDMPKKNKVRFTPKQVEAIMSGTQPGLSIIVGPPGTGKTDVATQIINLLYHNFPSERILLVAHSNQALNQLFQKIIALDIDPRHLLRLGHGEEELNTEASYSKYGRVESFLENRQTYLSEVSRLAASIAAEGAHGASCETADYFNQVFIRPAWSRFWTIADGEGATAQDMLRAFPFYAYFGNAPVPDLFPASATLEEVREIAAGCQYHLDKIFSELESIRPFEILRHQRDQANHLLVSEARIIAMTSTHAAMRRAEIAELGFRYDTLIMEEAAQITEIESFIPCAMQKPDPKTGELPLSRIVLVGDHYQNSPVIQNIPLRQYSNFEQSLFLRLVRLGVPTVHLDAQGRCRPSIAELFSWRYPGLGNLPHLLSQPEFSRANAGFKYDYQFIDVPEYQGQGEREPTPHFIQNLGEAEYAVALYQYVRLLGYPAKSIVILTTYAGQRGLIRDVLDLRCKGNRLFGLPKSVSTVDRYQGEQSDYVILSMVRTKTVGYLRDVRRLTVALSRARLGLYVLGRKELFDTCAEMAPAMELFSKRPVKLMVVPGEMFPATRRIADDVEGTVMEGVEHLGQYVYEMTQAKVKSLGGTLTVQKDEGAEDVYEEDEVVVGDDEDPLHEGV
jgi:intron-binding protein aquarius